MMKALGLVSIIGAMTGAALCFGCGGEDAPPPPPLPPGVGGGAPVIPAAGGGAAVAPTPVPAPPAMASNFGTITLAPGFQPDPNTVSGTSGGQVDASGFGSGCRGWVSNQPDHIFQATGQFNFMVFKGTSPGNTDTTLVIKKPDGTYLCDDDSGGNRNPLILGTNLAPGNYQIYVGSYRQGENAAYSLALSERPPEPTAHRARRNAPTIPAGSNFAAVALAPGFNPDPNVTNGTSGGQIEASGFATSCRGWVTPKPDHIFTATGAFGFLKFLVKSDNDTTLVIRRPDGRFYCDDDGGDGNNPMIMGPMGAGEYKVWVGSYREGENSAYTIGVSERPGATASSL